MAWALRITEPDPILHGLFFERFLNPERGGLPDIDIDVNPEGRDLLIQHISESYGQDNVSQIGTVGTLASRAAIDAVGKVRNMPFGALQGIKELIPYELQLPVPLAKAMQNERFIAEYNSDQDIASVVDIAIGIEGTSRAFGKHAGGVLISTEPVCDHVPVRYDGDTLVTQLDKDTVEYLGFIKFDFLGLTNLTTIDSAINHIVSRSAEPDKTRAEITHAFETLQDKKTFALLSKGKSYGVFQIEAPDVQRYLTRFKPAVFTDLVLLGALIRPGARQAEDGRALENMVLRRQNKLAPLVLHESVFDLLAETQGSVVYQEQVMGIARQVAGYTLAEADNLRRYMSRRKEADGMDEEMPKFVAKAMQASKLGKKDAEHIFTEISKFAAYGFNKSHALSYAYIAFQTAYLKANYPADFYAASISQEGNLDNIPLYQADAASLGCKMLPPGINESQVETVGDDKNNIRLGLGMVLQLGRAVGEAIVAERRENGPFTSLRNFLERCDSETVRQTQLLCLIEAGAFDRIPYQQNSQPVSRSTLKEQVSQLYNWMKDHRSRSSGDQGSLFAANHEVMDFPESISQPKAPLEQLFDERYRLGAVITGSLLKELSSRFKHVRTSTADLDQDTLTILVGEIALAYGTGSRKDNQWRADARTLEGQSFSISARGFDRLAKAKQPSLRGKLICIQGSLSYRGRFEATHALGESELAKWPVHMCIVLKDDALNKSDAADAQNWSEILAEFAAKDKPKGWPVVIRCRHQGKVCELRFGDYLAAADLKLLDQIENLPGVERVELHFHLI